MELFHLLIVVVLICVLSQSQNLMLKVLNLSGIKKFKPNFWKSIVASVLFCCNPVKTNTLIYSAARNHGCYWHTDDALLGPLLKENIFHKNTPHSQGSTHTQ